MYEHDTETHESERDPMETHEEERNNLDDLLLLFFLFDMGNSTSREDGSAASGGGCCLWSPLSIGFVLLVILLSLVWPTSPPAYRLHITSPAKSHLQVTSSPLRLVGTVSPAGLEVQVLNTFGQRADYYNYLDLDNPWAESAKSDSKGHWTATVPLVPGDNRIVVSLGCDEPDCAPKLVYEVRYTPQIDKSVPFEITSPASGTAATGSSLTIEGTAPPDSIVHCFCANSFLLDRHIYAPVDSTGHWSFQFEVAPNQTWYLITLNLKGQPQHRRRLWIWLGKKPSTPAPPLWGDEYYKVKDPSLSGQPVDMYAGPGKHYRVVARIPNGSIVGVDKRSIRDPLEEGSWAYAEFQGVRGYVPGEALWPFMNLFSP